MKLSIAINPAMNVLPERFAEKIDFTETCWLWKNGKFKDGYGQYWSNGRGISAHRFSWMCVNGVIPEGLAVLHKCDTPECVNPDHLFLGTSKENSLDMMLKGRAAVGENNGNSKLSQKEVEEIKSMYVRGKVGNKSNVSLRGLAIKYGVGKSTISEIVNKKTRKSG